MSIEKSVPSFDGLQLYCRIDQVDPCKAAVVIVHGLCEHQGRYDHVTAKLNEAGYSVYRFDHRGHGRSEGEKVYYDDFEQIIEDTDVFVDMAIEQNPGKKVFLLGHSMGGYAVALYGTAHPGKVAGIVMSGGWTRDNAGLDAAAEGDAHSYFANELGGGICSDPAVGVAYVNDPFVNLEMSHGLFKTTKAGHDWLRANPQLFTDPVLIMHGAKDGLVSPKDSLEFYEQIASDDRSLRMYADLYHEILNEPCKDRIIRDIVEWLDDRA